MLWLKLDTVSVCNVQSELIVWLSGLVFLELQTRSICEILPVSRMFRHFINPSKASGSGRSKVRGPEEHLFLFAEFHLLSEENSLSLALTDGISAWITKGTLGYSGYWLIDWLGKRTKYVWLLMIVVFGQRFLCSKSGWFSEPRKALPYRFGNAERISWAEQASFRFAGWCREQQ